MSARRPNACVFAGAGTGKTHGLITECLRLLGGADRDEPLPPSRLCLLTFTEKAAAEMRGRLAARVASLAAGEASEPELSAAFAAGGRAVPPAAEWRRVQAHLSGATIATFHGFCAGLLRRAPAGSGTPPDFVLLDEEESLDLLEELAERLVLERLEAADPAVEVLCGELDLRGVRRSGLVELLGDQARRERDKGTPP
ncbi:MAG: DNA helicase UvrD, partial [Myxococcaceae bacterium]